jgi:hypothetical protein
MSAQLLLMDKQCNNLDLEIDMARHICYQIASNVYMQHKSLVASTIMAIIRSGPIPLVELKELMAKSFHETAANNEIVQNIDKEVLKTIYLLVANSLIRIDRTTKENFVSWV